MATLSQTRPGAIRATAVLCLFVALASCGPATSSPPTRLQPVSENPSVAPITVLPPGAENRPLAPGLSGTEYTPDGLPALAPSRGVNADMLFAEKISGGDARFKRLENAVADLRREFEAVKPAIIRLAAVESDMEELITQLQSLVPQAAGALAPPPPPVMGAQAAPVNIDSLGTIPDIGPMPEAETAALTQTQPRPAPATPAPTPRAQQADAKPAKPAPAGTAVTGVRVGEHAATTRIVIDVTKQTSFTHNLDNSEKVLVIELPAATWAGAKSARTPGAPLLASWTASESGGGSILAIQLKGATEIVKASTLPGTGGSPFRIIVDLKKNP